MSDRQSKLETLRQVHQFPGIYVFKIIGENTPDFFARVLQSAIIVMGPQSMPEVTTRDSSGGKHQSVTLRIAVDSPEQVLDLYEAFATVVGVRFIL